MTLRLPVTQNNPPIKFLFSTYMGRPIKFSEHDILHECHAQSYDHSRVHAHSLTILSAKLVQF